MLMCFAMTIQAFYFFYTDFEVTRPSVEQTRVLLHFINKLFVKFSHFRCMGCACSNLIGRTVTSKVEIIAIIWKLHSYYPIVLEWYWVSIFSWILTWLLVVHKSILLIYVLYFSILQNIVACSFFLFEAIALWWMCLFFCLFFGLMESRNYAFVSLFTCSSNRIMYYIATTLIPPTLTLQQWSLILLIYELLIKMLQAWLLKLAKYLIQNSNHADIISLKLDILYLNNLIKLYKKDIKIYLYC